MAGFELRVFISVFNRVFMAFLTCILALGGATVGIITGAIKGSTTETGLFRGAVVGAVTGAITALQLMEMMANGEPFSKVALFCSLVNGHVFMEWVSPAVLKAYQWQTNATDTGFREIFDIFENDGINGLSEDSISRLPKCRFDQAACRESKCAICLDGLKNGEEGRKLASCGHTYHLICIDKWLLRHASCPFCRGEV